MKGVKIHVAYITIIVMFIITLEDFVRNKVNIFYNEMNRKQMFLSPSQYKKLFLALE